MQVPLQAPLQEGLHGGVAAAPLKKLLGAWILKDNGPIMGFQNMWISLAYDLHEGLDLAKRLLNNNQGQPQVRSYALLAIGQFGNQDEVALVEPLLKDTGICAVDSVGGKEIRTEVRDVALAALTQLTGQNLSAYGFERLSPGRLYMQLAKLGFPSTEKRAAALQQWADWTAKHPH